ncbi:unnamed protein product [Lactuca virosa]|uniref:FBD domain-containing protein n=1 Tax=Lactuca virosa TaxID=75947 RepID=A0AAU9NU76_9ASTR|nr:unnamed protein product [Lactuca virosa]
MHSCTNVSNFNIKALKLCSLVVLNCPGAMLLRFLNNPSLTRLDIQDFVEGEVIDLARVLCNLPELEDLSIDSNSLKLLSADNISKCLPHLVNSLKSLGLRNFKVCDLDQLHGALCLIRNLLNVKHFGINLNMEPQVDVEPASNHMETPNCLQCTLDQLQTVEIICLEGSKPELLFIKLLLAHSPSLKEITITPSKSSRVQKRLDIAKDVMQFPRASPKAKMFYLDPEP